MALLIPTPTTVLGNYLAEYPVGGETGSTPVPQTLLKLTLLCRYDGFAAWTCTNNARFSYG